MSKYNTDKPVYKKEDDFFQRYEFSRRIANSIKSYDNPDCVVFGISGVWGEGKTSVLNFIEAELTNSYPKIITLKFNPWRYGDENTLLASLFTSIAHKVKNSIKSEEKQKRFFRRPFLIQDEDNPLEREIETIGTLLYEYGEIASTFGMGKVAKAVGKGLSSVDIEEKKQRIEDILAKIQRRIVVFIDDIDRLDKDEIYSILKIVKLTGDFKYMTYILSFDENMVASAIGERFGGGEKNSGYNFLEKIVQVPLKIPKARKTALKNFCFNTIESAINQSQVNLSKEDIQRFVGDFSSHVLNRLTTPRLAVRYGNILQFYLPILKGEINIVDLMLIESIKIFYPITYQFIKLNPKIFIGRYHNPYDHRRDNSKIIEAKNKLDNALNVYSEIDKKSISSLLKSLFPQLREVYDNYSFHNDSYDEWYELKRICSPRYFDRYFTYSVPSNELSDVVFEGVLEEIDNLSIEELSKKFVYLIESTDADEFLTKFRSREKTFTWEEAKRISKAIVLIGKKIPDNPSNFFFNFGSSLSQAGIFIRHLIKKGTSDNEKFNLAKELMIKADTFAFAYEINRWLRKEKDEEKIFSVVQYQELANILIQRALNEANGKPIFETHEEYSAYLFDSWSEIDKPKLLKYLESKIGRNRLKLTSFLRACTPTVRSTAYPEPYKGDLIKEQFQWLKHTFDTDYLYSLIIDLSDGTPDASDVKFSHREPNPNTEDIIKQFIHWYEKDWEDNKENS